ncbi:hypothetical protein Cob_v011485 [Colletotrichum orbiculare MAFF 240422]|uniref:Uncharacterized protein n=1 Tax=Colletotrichum orbiculare (strain 104-T / ATCC 96160 / CBS 514.97 / LARS 414 / MAFF 240422) TaxID=1213857 RepID=A0A484FF07_COLOR|nr:hypothetical protein Cob_v011485 [Colletotrichum orbiculare MAFF 240422]
MGVTHSVATEVEIAASPATVRSVFLDWPRYKEWTKVWTMETKDAATKASEVKSGDFVNVNLKGYAFSPEIWQNSEELFQWNGSVPYVFSGAHSFHIRASSKTPGGTTFTQSEDFSGAFAFLMKPFWGFEKSTLTNWREFDQDIKKESATAQGPERLEEVLPRICPVMSAEG